MNRKYTFKQLKEYLNKLQKKEALTEDEYKACIALKKEMQLRKRMQRPFNYPPRKDFIDNSLDILEKLFG